MKQRGFVVSEKSQLETVIKRLAPYVGDGKVLSIKAGPYHKKRSLDQNARYWAMLTEISQQMPSMMDGEWYDSRIWHEHFRRQFLSLQPGPGDPVPKSTTELTTVEFRDYCDEIEAWAIDEGVVFFDMETA
jgi:hypothetical protein